MPLPDIRLLSSSESPVAFAQLARLHTEEIQGGFLTSLGTTLISHLYQAIARCSSAFIVVAMLDGNLIGFLCASTNTRRVYRSVLIRAWPHLLPPLIKHLFNAHTLKRCWETLRYPSRARRPDLPAAEILNFCVTRRFQRTGVGRLLFAAMESEFTRRGIRQIRIVTGASQHSAVRFYEKLGAECVSMIEVHTHVDSRLFSYTIRDSNSQLSESGSS